MPAASQFERRNGAVEVGIAIVGAAKATGPPLAVSDAVIDCGGDAFEPGD
jgi:hypothetical protein